ncbi:hypothetical protein PIROE2DRAFT_57716 [Piromyces sp. E2]|nr:hypothetical protein PIROE2DRAFT_57716 [Piromyces sp. E2]|eukprot:OUM68942.1 hypothetical protein PIROE2DRAFT_57716 [Piromyces sp. E2]
MNYDNNKIKNSNKNLKSLNGGYNSRRSSIDSPLQKSNTNLSNVNNLNFFSTNEIPKFLQQENPGKLQIFKSNSITEPEVNTSTLNYNGYTSHDMRLLWTAFGNMPDDEKNTFLKGLVYRFSQKQIDLTCTLLNLKVEDYMLLNRDFDCDEIKKQSVNMNPEEVKKCLEFVCDRCKKVQSFLIDVNEIMMEKDLKKDLLLLIKSISKIISGKYICCYSINTEDGNNLSIQASNWSFSKPDSGNPSVTLLSLPKADNNIPVSSIFAGKEIMNKKTVNAFNIYNSEYYTNEVANHYNIDMKCVLSTPIFAPDNCKVIGILEVINKKDDNDMPYFSIEDEYILKTMSSIWSIILRQCIIQENSEKHLDNIKNVFTVTKILNHTMNIDELIKISASLLKEITYSSGAHLFILEETGQSDVMHTGKTIKSHKVYEHPLYNEEVDDLYENTTIKTMICVPVKNSEGKVIENFPNVVLTLNSDGSLKTINQKDMMFYENEIKLMQEKSYTQWLENYPMLVADITKISRRGGIAYAYNYDMSGDDGEPFFVNYTILRFNKDDDPKYYGIFDDKVQLKMNKLFESPDEEEDKDDHVMNIKNTIGRYINNINSVLNNNDYGLENTTMICFENVSNEKRSMVAIEKYFQN